MPSSRFYYSKAGKQAGPLTSGELKQHALTGMLSPDDTVWKEGSDKRVKACAVKGLFQDGSAPPPKVASPSPSNTTTTQLEVHPGINETDQNTTGSDSISFGARIKTAATLAAKKAEIAKLTWFTLPSMYGQLGRTFFETVQLNGRYPAECALIQEIRRKLADFDRESETIAPSSEQRLKSRVSSMAVAVKRKAIQEKLKHSLDAAYCQLGKAALNENTESADAIRLVAEIRHTLSLVQQISSDIAKVEKLSGNVFLTPARLLNAFVAVTILGVVYFGFQMMFSSGTTGKSESNVLNSKLGQPITVDLDGLSGTREIRDRLQADSEKIARRATADAEHRRAEDEQSRKNDAEFRKREEERTKQAEAANLNASVKTRLDRLYSHFVPKQRTLSDYPPRSRTPTTVKKLSRPVRSLATSFNKITFVELSPDSKLLAFGGEHGHTSILSFNDFTGLSFDDGFLPRREELSCYKARDAFASSKSYERDYRSENFPIIMKEHIAEGKMIYGVPLFSSHNSWLAGVDDWPWSKCHANGSRNLNHSHFPSYFAIWKKAGNTLRLEDVHSVDKGVPAKPNDFLPEIAIVNAIAVADRLVVLATPRGDAESSQSRSRVHAEYLQVWKETGIVGSTSVMYALGANQESPFQMAVNQFNGHVALMYDNAVRIYDSNSIQKIEGKVDPLKTLPAPYPSPDLHHRGYLSYSVDGSILAVMIKATDPAKGRTYPFIQFYDARNWNLIGSSEVGRDPSSTSVAAISPNGKYCAIAADITTPVSEMKQIQIWSTHKPALVQRIYAADAGKVFFLDNKRLVTGSGPHRDLLELSQRSGRNGVPSRDQTLQDVFVWDVETGQVLSQIVLRWVSAVAGTVDGRYLVTARDKFVDEPAIIEAWDLATGVEDSTFDPFDWERREEFRLHSEKDMGISIKAPYVRRVEVDQVRVGMSYGEVMKQLLGFGDFAAEMIEVRGNNQDLKATVRMTVTYEAMGTPDANWKFIFEGELFDEPYKILLVKKVQSSGL